MRVKSITIALAAWAFVYGVAVAEVPVVMQAKDLSGYIKITEQKPADEFSIAPDQSGIANHEFAIDLKIVPWSQAGLKDGGYTDEGTVRGWRYDPATQMFSIKINVDHMIGWDFPSEANNPDFKNSDSKFGESTSIAYTTTWLKDQNVVMQNGYGANFNVLKKSYYKESIVVIGIGQNKFPELGYKNQTYSVLKSPDEAREFSKNLLLRIKGRIVTPLSGSKAVFCTEHLMEAKADSPMEIFSKQCFVTVEILSAQILNTSNDELVVDMSYLVKSQ